MSSSILTKINPDCVASTYYCVVSIEKDWLLNDTDYTEEHWEELKKQMVANGNVLLFEGNYCGSHKAFFSIQGVDSSYEGIAYCWDEILEQIDIVSEDDDEEEEVA